jgi:hypothetical protein
MTNRTIARLIRDVNAGGRRVFLLPPEDATVRRGIAWPQLPGEEHPHGYDFWFVFAEGKCVAAILKMDDVDLHVYTSPKYRNRGLMKRAMTEVVFPDLAASGMARAKVSLSTVAGEGLWRGLGGNVSADRRRGEIGLKPFRRTVEPPHALAPLTPDRRKMVREQLLHAAALLSYAADALRTSGAVKSVPASRLDGLTKQTAKIIRKIDDLAYEARDARLDLHE